MKKILITIFFILLVASSGTAYYYYTRFSDATKSIPQSTQKTNEVQELVARVGAIMVLPADETPTIATVADLSQLKGQAFFANAKVGDKVLIYASARKAILYDPVANKIVEIAPVDINSSALQGGTVPQSAATSTVKKKK